MKPFKVVIVEDVKLEMKGTLEILRTEVPEAEVIGTAMNEEELWAGLRVHVPELLLLDLGLGGSTTVGIDICRQARQKYPDMRILIFKEICRIGGAFSLNDIEQGLETVDKSSIFRTLEIFEKHHLVHSIDDGTGSIKFEVCEGEDDCTIADMHTHFYCEKCHRTFCLKEISAPLVDLPEGFQANSVNYIIKGLCPDCCR